MALFGNKLPSGEDRFLAAYKVAYQGGLPDLPKAKSGEIRLLVMPDGFQLHPTIGSKSYWNHLDIPYGAVNDLSIVARQASTFEAVVGGMDSPHHHQENNIHIDYLDGSGTRIVLRLEMLTGVTVQGQAKKCRELEDRLRTFGIRDKFRPARS